MGSTINGVYVPSNGESGWGTNVSANFTRQSENHHNVKAYGATGNGTTDDTTAIQAAITAAGSAATVYFPPGTYYTAAGIVVPITATGIVLRGAGQRATKIKGTGVSILSMYPFQFTLADMSIYDSNASNNASTIALDIGDGTNAIAHWLVDNVEIAGMNFGSGVPYPTIGTGIRLRKALEGTIRNSYVIAWKYGITAVTYACNANHISGCQIRCCEKGIYVQASTTDDMTIDGGVIEGNNIGVDWASTVGLLTTKGVHYEQTQGAQIGIQTTAWLTSLGNYYSNGTTDISVPSGTHKRVSVGDMFGAGGIAHSGSGTFRVIAPVLTGGTYTGPTWFDDTMATLTYSASMTPDIRTAGAFHIVVTNGTAMTINNPSNVANFTTGLHGKNLRFVIYNNSGGAMGAITWDTKYKLAGAFTNPANTKRRTIEFMYEGSHSDGWLEVSRAAADI